MTTTVYTRKLGEMTNEITTVEGTISTTYLTHLINRKRDLEWTMSTRNRNNSTNYTLLCTKDKASPVEGRGPKHGSRHKLGVSREFRGDSGCCDPGEYASVLQKSESSLISGMLPDEGYRQNQIANLSLYKNKEQYQTEKSVTTAEAVGSHSSKRNNLEAQTPVTW